MTYLLGGGLQFGIEVYKATRDNQLVADLTAYAQKGKVNYNADRRLRRGGSIELRGAELLTPYLDYLAPFLRLTWDSGAPDTFLQMGLYTLRAPAGARSRNVTVQSFALNDLTYELDQAALSSPYTVAAGDRYTDHLLALVEATGIERTNIPSLPATVVTGKTFMAGSNRLDVLNEGFSIVGCYALSTDGEGRIDTDLIRPLDQQEPAWLIGNADIMGDAVTQPVDRDPVNVVKLIVERTDQDPLIGSARNDEPDSPTSTVRLGREIVRVERVTDVSSQSVLDALAASLLQEGRSFYETVKLRLKPHMVFGSHDVIRCGFDGELQYLNGRWNVRTWDAGLSISDPTVSVECYRYTDEWKGVLV